MSFAYSLSKGDFVEVFCVAYITASAGRAKMRGIAVIAPVPERYNRASTRQKRRHRPAQSMECEGSVYRPTRIMTIRRRATTCQVEGRSRQVSWCRHRTCIRLVRDAKPCAMCPCPGLPRVSQQKLLKGIAGRQTRHRFIANDRDHSQLDR